MGANLGGGTYDLIPKWKQDIMVNIYEHLYKGEEISKEELLDFRDVVQSFIDGREKQKQRQKYMKRKKAIRDKINGRIWYHKQLRNWERVGFWEDILQAYNRMYKENGNNESQEIVEMFEKAVNEDIPGKEYKYDGKIYND